MTKASNFILPLGVIALGIYLAPELRKAVGGASTGVSTAFQGVGTGLSTAGQGLGFGLGTAGAGLGTGISNAGQGLGLGIGTAGAGLGSGIGSFGNSAGELFESVGSTGSSVIGKVGETSNSLLDVFQNTFQGTANLIEGGFSSAGNLISSDSKPSSSSSNNIALVSRNIGIATSLLNPVTAPVGITRIAGNVASKIRRGSSNSNSRQEERSERNYTPFKEKVKITKVLEPFRKKKEEKQLNYTPVRYYTPVNQ